MQNSQKYLEFSNTGEKKINASSPTLVVLKKSK